MREIDVAAWLGEVGPGALRPGQSRDSAGRPHLDALGAPGSAQGVSFRRSAARCSTPYCTTPRSLGRSRIAFCQDTGYAVVYLTVGQDVHFVGGDLTEAVNRGVARGLSRRLSPRLAGAHPMDR